MTDDWPETTQLQTQNCCPRTLRNIILVKYHPRVPSLLVKKIHFTRYIYALLHTDTFDTPLTFFSSERTHYWLKIPGFLSFSFLTAVCTRVFIIFISYSSVQCTCDSKVLQHCMLEVAIYSTPCLNMLYNMPKLA